MSGGWAIYRRELAAAFEAPAAWLAYAAAVAALQGLFFAVGFPIGQQQIPDFWDAGVAGLQVIFAWLPALLAVLAPALSMGVWSEERRNGTEELLLAWPLSSTAIVVGKFLATWTVLAVLLTGAILPVAWVVDGLGPLDRAAAVGGWLGGLLLGGACVAIGQLVSACTRDSLAAFVLGALVLGGLWFAGLAIDAFTPALAELVAGISPAAHYLNSAALGLFDLGDGVYFLLVIAAALFGTGLAVEARRQR